MRVTVSSAGIFHSYPLVRGVQQAGYLQRFITSLYNRYETGIDRSKVTEIRLPGYASWLATYMPSTRFRAWSYWLNDNWYDRWSVRFAGDCDIFHFFNHQGLYALRAAKAQGARTICERASAHPRHQHAILAEEFARWGLHYPDTYRRLHAKHEQEYLESDYVMVCSDFVHRSLRQYGVPESKLLSVHLGFDPQRFRPAPKTDTVFRVMYAGGISLQKGIPYLLEAFAQANLPNSELLLVGDAYPEAQVFLPKYQQLLGAKLRHVPFVPHAQLAHYFQQSSVFVFPSLQDGFGMVVYEAAACGLPVIISENTGAAIRHGQDGYVLPIRAVAALVTHLEALYQQPAWAAELGQNAWQYVQQFTWQHYQQQVVAHYQRIAALHA
jgi:glycosyltransferase involved in cell wall biosynthesis